MIKKIITKEKCRNKKKKEKWHEERQEREKDNEEGQKKEVKKKRRRRYEPETIRLGTCSLNDYATQHLTLNACNC